ncbi:MAG: hypothetical protein LBS35_10595 [Synergistaceae bacterium]|jgi:hypothetical protein|nr:hypothetical protein [Synergistaceae bacterium]
MHYDDVSVQWWESIRGPAIFINTLVNHLRSKNFVLLDVPEDLPWRKEFRSSAESVLRGYENDLMVTYIDCLDECPGIANVADAAAFLLKKFADNETQNGYRAASGKTIQQYMIQNKVLKDRVLWIKGVGEPQESLWLSFCNSYKPTLIADGLFVIESYNSNTAKNCVSHIKPLLYDEYVTDYDALLFDSLLASAKNLTVYWKQYAAAVVSALCGRDAEVSERVIGEARFDEVDIIDLVLQIAQDQMFEKRVVSKKLSPSHIFSVIRNEDMQELKRRVWKAQLQLIFPMIEIERFNFVEKWKTQIEEALSVSYREPQTGKERILTQYDEYLQSAVDVEIGTINRMLRLRRFNATDDYLLYLPEENDRRRVRLLYEMRNNLAHMKSCTVEQIKDLFTDYPYWQG